MSIDRTAHVHPEAKLGRDVEVGPFAVIGPNVEIGDGTRIGPHCIVEGHTVIGRNNWLVGHVSLGGPPQDISYRGEPTRLRVGDNNTFREFVTVNVGTAKGDGITIIGSKCLFMACSHVGHDCIVGDGVIMVNNALIGGHVLVEDRAIINGAAAITQFATIGALAYIGGLTRIVQDVPPFMIIEGHPAKVRGINLIGLKRSGASEQTIDALKDAHRMIYRSGKLHSEAFAELECRPDPTPEVTHLIQFLKNKQKGKNGRAREALRKNSGA